MSMMSLKHLFQNDFSTINLAASLRRMSRMITEERRMGLGQVDESALARDWLRTQWKGLKLEFKLRRDAKLFQMLNMAKMVWLFDIRPAGTEPLDVSMNSAFNDGILVAPKKFPVQFVPRSEKHVQVIRDEFEKARDIFARYE